MRFGPEAPVAELKLYDTHGVPLVETAAPCFDEYVQEINSYSGYCDEVEVVAGIPKPDWFFRAEAQARRFIKSIGFEGLKPFCLLDEQDEVLQDVGFDDEITVALAIPLYDRIFIRARKLEEMRAARGPLKLAAILVHELAHDTTGRINQMALFTKDDPEELSSSFRSGFAICPADGPARGMFLEEGFAHFVSGWFIRSQGDYSRVVDVVEPLTITVPDHLEPGKEGMTAGPDGYAIELLAWGAEQKSLMAASDFIATLLDSRRRDTQTGALRTIARIINQIRPDLYTDLQKLEYGRESWEKGLQLVFDAVTGRARA
jgi:hypothetical protein